MPAKYAKELLESIVQESSHYAEVCRKLGIKPFTGSNTRLIQTIWGYGIDTAHFRGHSWNKGKEFKPLDALLSKDAVRRRLIKIRGRRCESCNLDNWLNKPITLEVDHIDGNNKNNKEENLKLLCPNCHSFTGTWRRKKRGCGATVDAVV